MESRIDTFDDWKDTFQAWQKDINYDTKLFTSVLRGMSSVKSLPI